MRVRRSAIALLAAPFLAAALLTGCSKDHAASGEPVEYQAQDLRTGDPVDLADLQGKAVLVSSWATWCAPCRKELPELDRLYQDRKAEGLEVVAVNVDPAGASSKQVIPTVDELELTMPTWKDGEAGFVEAFGAVSVPTNVLVGRDGEVIERWNGPIDPDSDEVRAAIDEALG
ncbi:MAG: TlpA disulfide reductase family protein [Acidimicrobiales bacterium]